ACGSPSGAPSASRIGRPLSHSPTSSGDTSNLRWVGSSRTGTWKGVSLTIEATQYRSAIPRVKRANFMHDARVIDAPARSLIGSLMLAIGLAGCTDKAEPALAFGPFGPLSGDSGRGSFRFGVATAATQIEDMNTHTDWYLWTLPVADGGMGQGP